MNNCEYKMYSTNDLAELLSITPRSARTWIAKHNLKTVRVGRGQSGEIRVFANEVHKVLDEAQMK